MAPLIEIGVDFEEAERESRPQPLPEGTYEFQIESGEIVETGPESKTPGRPMIRWRLRVINAEEPSYNNRSLFYNTPLPWTNPQGEFDKSGLGLLVNLYKAVGLKWEGGAVNTDELVGQTGVMLVTQREVNGEIRNEIKKLFPKNT